MKSKPTYREIIDRYTAEIQQVVQQRGGSVEIKMGEPATASACEAFEKVNNVRLPNEYKRFLILCDGFESTIFGPRQSVASVIQISGLSHLEEDLAALRYFFEDVESSAIEAQGPHFDVDAACRSYVSFSEGAWRVFDLENAPEAEARVIRGSLEESFWLTTPVQLAVGFYDYFYKSIMCALLYGTFDYDMMPFPLLIEDN